MHLPWARHDGVKQPAARSAPDELGARAIDRHAAGVFGRGVDKDVWLQDVKHHRLEVSADLIVVQEGTHLPRQAHRGARRHVWVSQCVQGSISGRRAGGLTSG